MDPVLRRCLPTDCDDCKSVNGSSIRCDYAFRICGPVREEDFSFSLGSMCNYGLSSKCAVKQGKIYDSSKAADLLILERMADPNEV
jgi:hypothetical protein